MSVESGVLHTLQAPRKSEGDSYYVMWGEIVVLSACTWLFGGANG